MFAAMWRALTRPSLTAFEQARADANLGRALVATLVIGAATGFVGGLINFISTSDSIIEVLTLAIINPLRLVFALIVVQAILFSAARALGGRGDFAKQAYLGALVFVPINALASLLTAIPTVGAFLAFAVLMYGVVVNVWALRAAHGGRAWQTSNIVLLILSFIGGIIGWVAMSSISQ
jgi:hypothetical protein